MCSKASARRVGRDKRLDGLRAPKVSWVDALASGTVDAMAQLAHTRHWERHSNL